MGNKKQPGEENRFANAIMILEEQIVTLKVAIRRNNRLSKLYPHSKRNYRTENDDNRKTISYLEEAIARLKE